MKYLILIISVVLMACQSTEEHAHDAEGGHLNKSEETPTIVHTKWTEKTELFVEFPALIVGKESRFAAHFTFIDKHKPVTKGSVTVSLIGKEKGIRQTVDSPSSVGIFKPTLIPQKAGVYQLVFELNTPNLSDKIVIQNVRVFANLEEAINTLGNAEEDDGSITFLKEQAWKIDFQTAVAKKEEIFEVIPTSGVWEVAPSDYKTIVATSSGTVDFLAENLTEGSKVTKGQTLATINSSNLSSNNLGTEIQNAKAAYEQAKSAFERKKELYESEIVPKSEFEQVREKYQIAKSNYETLSSGYSNGGKKIIVPFDGFIKSIPVENGDFVEQGASVLAISKHQSSILKVQVSSIHALSKEQIKDLWYQPTTGKWSSLKENNGVIQSIGKEVNRNSPLVSVFAKVNELVQMPEGSYTDVQIAYGNSEKVVTIPETALLEDYGKYSVIVQISGESFERRDVIIGKRNGNKVEIKEGVKEDEVVVTTGAYQVKMASMSGQAPAHGHDH
jgi:RND family efflux transporter MFP subunit